MVEKENNPPQPPFTKGGRGGIKVLVLGVGNLLLKDDGFGVHAIHALEDTSFPENVRLLDAGTISHQLIPLFHSVDYLIVIDVIEGGARPGSIFRFSPEDMKFKSERMLSLHQMGLIDILQMAELTGARPKTIIIGVQPKDVSSWSLELSDEVKEAIPKVKDLVFEELKRIKAL